MTGLNPIDPMLLTDILALGQGEVLLILFDAFGYDLAQYCSDIATESGIPFCARFIPLDTQLQHARSKHVPGFLDSCVRECKGLIFAVSDHEDCTWFRAAILNSAKDSGTKILHLPGVDLDLLTEALQGLDLARLQQDAAELGTILDGASTVEIYTRGDRKGKRTSHKLSLYLGGRQFHYDTGIPTPGEIAQLPAGEVYVAPKEYTAEGTLVINGSSPERVFDDNDLAILHFAGGAVDIERSFFAETVQCQGFRQELLGYEVEDAKNVVLAEFGIGLNRSILHLTGKPIHDEKAAGTAHVALGHNTPFGGEIECNSHIDLICIPERIVVDGAELPCQWGLGGFCTFERRNGDVPKTS